MADYLEVTHKELDLIVKELSMIHDIVRTVDAGLQKTIVFSKDGKPIFESKNCFDVWGKESRCSNCISAIAFQEKKRFSKFEVMGNRIYHVLSQYVEVDGMPCLLEIVDEDMDQMLSKAFDQERLMQQLRDYATQLYTDSLTQVKNRRYYDEQIAGLEMSAVAMVDVDQFKAVNDQNGHLCGDLALKAVAQTIQKNIRRDDCLIRYGGDEFFLVYANMNPDYLEQHLNKIRAAVEAIRLESYPDLRLTISVGAVSGKDTAQNMLQEADQYLYRSKEKRNFVTCGVYQGIPQEN